MDGAYKKINYILVSLINEIWELEGKAIITEEFADLTNNDMHVIEAVGLGDGNNMSCVARKLNITTGSLTTSIRCSTALNAQTTLRITSSGTP